MTKKEENNLGNTCAKRLLFLFNNIKLSLAVIIVLLFTSKISTAQTSLTINDALAPYKLSPTLLNNGHFSISTNYTTPTKGIIYREDGTSGKPINYTSFFHVKVDNIVFQQSYESDTSDFTIPTKNPIKVQSIFPDTISGTPRINARSFGVMPDGDTIRFLFTMFPVKRSSGGFVRMSVTVQNSTSKKHSVGVLLLIDTKIGNNDQAPIATTFGYSTIEQQFDNGIAQGIPDFWLGLEGTPISPGLVARGNLRDDNLITPDRLLFGNWTDYTSQGIRGLGSVMWKERLASTNQYTDSGVLLIWDEEDFAIGQTKLKASTEIGIVDSLNVAFGGGNGGGGGGGGGGGFGLAGIGTCLSVEVQHENPCGIAGYSPYLPDTLQALYLVSNLDTVKNADNVRLVIENLPLGLLAPTMTSTVIPTNLLTLQTGVSTLSLYPIPRLVATSYRVPIAVIKDISNTVVLRDTLEVCVPGLLGVLEARDKTYPPVCPQTVDTLAVTFNLKGNRCLPTVSALLTGNPVDVGQFSIVQPIPAIAKADSIITILIRYAPTINNSTPTIGVVLTLNDSETLVPGNTTNVSVFDTAFVTVSSKEAEFEFGRRIDTLNFGRICIGDTAKGDWDILNIGGCSVQLQSGFTTAIQGANVFSITPTTLFPDAIPRGGSKTIDFVFTPTIGGQYTALAIVKSPSIPFLDTLVLVGEADIPAISSLLPIVDFDTLCVNQSSIKSIELKNTTACPIVIDSIQLTNTFQGWSIRPSGAFTISPNSSVFVNVTGVFTSVGQYSADVSVFSQTGIVQTRAVAEVVTRIATTSDSLSFGDVHVDSTKRDSIVVHSTGTAPIILNSITVSGLFPSEYSIALSNGIILPHSITPNDSLVVYIDFKPKDIENRNAIVNITLNNSASCSSIKPLRLLGRGVQPLVDIRSRTLAVGKVCIGEVLDTVIIIRNPGNAPLIIDSIYSSGQSGFTLSNKNSIQIVPDSIFKLGIRFIPTTIGDEKTTLTFSSNGKWITPTDTTLSLFATGIVCGTISADTIDAEVGKPLAISLRFTPNKTSTKTAEELTRLMNQSSNSAMSIGLKYNSNLVRLRSFRPNEGMIGRQLPAILQVNNSDVTIRTTNSNLDESTVIAVLQGDVLLNNEYQTPVRVKVDSFANGFSKIITKDGLVRAQYCAFGNRQVNTNAISLFLKVIDSPDYSVTVYSKDNSHIHLSLVNSIGEEVSTLFSGNIESGSHQFSFPDEIKSGLYFVVLKSPNQVLNEKCVFLK
ncbi:MAG: choice-of-anchor D domain-containing protein [Bacteroidetes bacterium]|nr:choice-of-anchor D domain-containing protein [Bacteroidota bacterium]